MTQRVIDAEELSAAILAIEDELVFDAVEARDLADRYEQQAVEIGDQLLIQRARLCQIGVLMRAGDLAGAASRIWAVHRWAEDNQSRMLLARTHLVWGNIHRLLGDYALNLEHSVLAVELLDQDSTDFMRIWHLARLGGALGLVDSRLAARERYEQAERIAREVGHHVLTLWVLNNYAWSECLMDEPVRAERIIERLRPFAAEHGFDLHPTILDTIGSIEIENGQFEQAERTMLECVRLDAEGRDEDADSMAQYLLTLARAQGGMGALDRAQQTLDECRAICEERELGHVMVRVHQDQAELYAARGDFAAAFAEHKKFFAAHLALGSAEREAQARTRQAMYETAEAREEAERFREQARRDPLTGLRNRRYVDEQLPGLIQRDAELTLAIVDLDHFKQINDRLSHDVGDQVLIKVARLLESELSDACPEGFVARMGGEEFLLVLPGVEVRDGAQALDQIRTAVRAHAWPPITGELPVTVSIGVATRAESPAATQPVLLSIADRNLYAAKHAGRDRVVFNMPRDARNRAYRDVRTAA
ncbi:diguanylate cyclase [Actinoplanes sp. NPDC049265]|uniref:GGDEF domain-containing protein n=1 Tax=Actinoplanes sp. NPDC049265 TaxID=3363902 RepID=UPI0037158019